MQDSKKPSLVHGSFRVDYINGVIINSYNKILHSKTIGALDPIALFSL